MFTIKRNFVLRRTMKFKNLFILAGALFSAASMFALKKEVQTDIPGSPSIFGVSPVITPRLGYSSGPSGQGAQEAIRRQGLAPLLLSSKKGAAGIGFMPGALAEAATEKRLFANQAAAETFAATRDAQSTTGKKHIVTQHPAGHYVVEIEPLHHTETRRFVTEADAAKFAAVRNARNTGRTHSPKKVDSHCEAIYEVTIDANA